MSDHDPICDELHRAAVDARQPHRCMCRLIKRVRADERARWQPRRPTTPHHAAFCWCPNCHTNGPIA